MSCTKFRGGLYSPEKVVRHICLNILNIRIKGMGVQSDACETPIHGTNQEDIYALMEDL